jgi:hypothetical protein
MAKLQITIKGLVNELYLDDLRDKTHRGMTGQALKGRSTGGRLFGYRTRRGPDGAEWIIFEPEAEIVRRIFRNYAGGASMKTLTMRLNEEMVPFPGKVTRHGPTRRGWAVSTIHTILSNEKYMGRWVWNKAMFVKDAETGKRTAVLRPKDDWVVEDRPDLQLVDLDLWTRTRDRLNVVRAAYGATGTRKRPRGQAPELYSPHLLSGLIRCGLCGARVTIQTSQRKKNGVVYRYGRYRCSFHVAKGPSVCSNSMSIPQTVLEIKLIEKFQQAMTPEMIDYLVSAANGALQETFKVDPQQLQNLEAEQQRVDSELSNLVAFVAKGQTSSSRLHEEIVVREQRLVELDQQIRHLRDAVVSAPYEIDRAAVEVAIKKLNDLLAMDPAGARREIQKHIDDLRMVPAPELGERAVRVTGQPKVDGLLGGEEAVRLQLVAGARYAECYTTRETHWLDLR